MVPSATGERVGTPTISRTTEATASRTQKVPRPSASFPIELSVLGDQRFSARVGNNITSSDRALPNERATCKRNKCVMLEMHVLTKVQVSVSCILQVGRRM
jgi:hypothetical protein